MTTPVADVPAQFQTFLAFDFGLKRTGVASGNRLLRTATPQQTIRAEGADAGESVYASTMTIPGGLEMTTSKDVLEAIATGAGPRKLLVTLGYSAWGEGQLESELAENSWLTVGADPSVIFDTPIEQRYDKALKLLGLESWMLSPGAGHA